MLTLDCGAFEAAATPNGATYTIYAIQRISDGKAYVGLTSRPVPVRIKAHVDDAMRRRKVSRAGSLPSAIRQAILTGQRFEEAFTASVLVGGLTVDTARTEEIRWIGLMEAAAPIGFNLMPGGRSIGGPGNAQQVLLRHPQQGTIPFRSFYQAIEFRNRELFLAGRRPLEVGTVYARLDTGWAVEEALEYRSHADGRVTREPFICDGVSHDRLRDVSLRLGLPISTLRSRLHRAAKAGDAEVDVTVDRRKVLSREARTRCLDLKAFARRTGLPLSTVAYRYDQLERLGRAPAAMGEAELHRHLITAQDRRKIITLTVPDGRSFTGGQRAVIRQVLAEWALAWDRKEWLGESAIRRRLRMVEDGSPEAIRWAFGFDPTGNRNS